MVTVQVRILPGAKLSQRIVVSLSPPLIIIRESEFRSTEEHLERFLES